MNPLAQMNRMTVQEVPAQPLMPESIPQPLTSVVFKPPSVVKATASSSLIRELPTDQYCRESREFFRTFFGNLADPVANSEPSLHMFETYKKLSGGQQVQALARACCDLIRQAEKQTPDFKAGKLNFFRYNAQSIYRGYLRILAELTGKQVEYDASAVQVDSFDAFVDLNDLLRELNICGMKGPLSTLHWGREPREPTINLPTQSGSSESARQPFE